MKYRTMRFIGGEENVSLLGLGCMRFPLKEDGTIDEVQAEAMIERAINAGINYIDTAYPYHKGESEPFLGRALKKYPRNSFYLATKLPVWLVNSVEDAERLFKEQLSRLQTKYIDYYLLHALDAGRWEKLVKEGIIQWAEEKKARSVIWDFLSMIHIRYSERSLLIASGISARSSTIILIPRSRREIKAMSLQLKWVFLW